MKRTFGYGNIFLFLGFMAPVLYFFYYRWERYDLATYLLMFAGLYIVVAYYYPIVSVTDKTITVRHIFNPFAKAQVIHVDRIKSMHIAKITSRHSKDCLRIFLLPDAEELRVYIGLRKSELKKLHDCCLQLGQRVSTVY